MPYKRIKIDTFLYIIYKQYYNENVFNKNTRILNFQTYDFDNNVDIFYRNLCTHQHMHKSW